MISQRGEKLLTPDQQSKHSTYLREFSPVMPSLLCATGLILSAWMMVAPLNRLYGPGFLSNLPTNGILQFAGTWLPADLGLSQNHTASFINTNMIEFLLLTSLAFIIYGICALFIARKPAYAEHPVTFRIILMTTFIAGLIFVLFPAALSHDAFVYAGIGRVLVTHSANPYFVPLSAFPNDPFIGIDDWNNAVAAYGPLWLVICAFSTLLFGNHPLQYLLGFRLFGLCCHLLNIWLVYLILRRTNSSRRTIILGTQLYAWNPLALLESCMGGHNDTLMVSFILLGIFLSIQAEKITPMSWRDYQVYILPVIAFTLASLIKFTTLPLLALFIVMLLWKSLQTNYPDRVMLLKASLLTLTITGLSAGLVLLAFYGPFWSGHSLRQIVNSFTSPPSSKYSEYSIMRAIGGWVQLHGLPSTSSGMYKLVYVLSRRPGWNNITVASQVGTLLFGAAWLWRRPTTRTMILASIVTLGALLIVTPWFFPWYVIWLVALIAIVLPITTSRIERGLFAFSLAFSASAFCVYLYTNQPPIGGWIGFACLSTIGPPLVAFLLFALIKRHALKQLSQV